MNIHHKKKIFVVAGESSGDQHGASYIVSHSNINSDLVFTAIGQEEIKKSPAELIYDSEIISVVGIMEVISKYSEIKKALSLAKQHIIDNKPDLIVLIDYIEFNTKIAKFAKTQNIPVLFYIAPQVWAWREKRTKSFVKNIDHLAVVFPFEKHFFNKYTSNVTFVGHPLIDNDSLKINSIDHKERIIDLGLFPGSRESEIKNNIYLMLDCIQKNKNENIRIFYANNNSREILLSLLPSEYHNLLESGKNKTAIANCKKALCASGTITLELAILGIPMVIMYKLSFISYLIMKSMIKIKYIGLVNLILGDKIGSDAFIKEFIQPNYSDQVDIMVELNKIDKDENYRNMILKKLTDVKDTLEGGATNNLIKIANKLLRINE